MPASGLGKLKMVAQVVAILALMLASDLTGEPGRWLHLLGLGAMWVVLGLALWSAVEYLPDVRRGDLRADVDAERGVPSIPILREDRSSSSPGRLGLRRGLLRRGLLRRGLGRRGLRRWRLFRRRRFARRLAAGACFGDAFFVDAGFVGAVSAVRRGGLDLLEPLLRLVDVLALLELLRNLSSRGTASAERFNSVRASAR